MGNVVSIRDLRNKGGAVIDEVAHGESVVITRDGRPVAELRPIARAGIPAAELIRRRRSLPVVDPVRMRADIDAWLDPAL